MIDKNVYFDEYSFDCVKKRSLEFAKYIKENKLTYICLYCENTFNFVSAFFGAMHANAILNIVASVDSSNVNDENFDSMRSICSDEFDLNLDFKFNIFTSGSSGASKKIEKTLNDMFNEANYMKSLIPKKTQKVFSSVPHQHMYGLTFKIFLPLVCGFKVISRQLNHPKLISLENFSDAIFISSPIMIKAAINYNCIEILDEANLIITSGAKLDSSLRQYTKTQILEIYGSTETGVIALNIEDGFKPVVDISFNSENRLIVNSPWCKEFHSNDIAKMQNGRLILQGRYDRIIKIGDRRFDLDFGGELLKKNELIHDARCDILDGEKRVSAIITLSKKGKEQFRKVGKHGIVSEIKQFILSQLGTNVRKFKIVDQIYTKDKFSKSDFEAKFNQISKPIFSIVNKNENSLKFRTYMDEFLFFYDGHFPKFPLTPGFMQIEFIFECLNMIGIDIKNRVTSLQNLKFKSFLRPSDEAFIEILLQNNRVKFQILANEKIVSSGSIDFV